MKVIETNEADHGANLASASKGLRDATRASTTTSGRQPYIRSAATYDFPRVVGATGPYPARRE